jgi:hypothetical protein
MLEFRAGSASNGRILPLTISLCQSAPVVVRSNLSLLIESTIASGSKLSHVAILRAFCDESYTHRDYDHRTYAVAGFLGLPEAWASFSERWMAVLRPKGLTHFHMTAYESETGPFEDMPPKDAMALFNSLIDVIIDSDITPFAAILELGKWDELPDDAKEAFQNPYMVLLGLLFRGMPPSIQWPGDVKIHFTCEFPPEEGFVEECLRGFAELRASDEPCAPRLHSLNFEDKMMYREFDAADILAYAMMKQERKELQVDPMMRYELLRLMSHYPFLPVYRLNRFEVG